MRTLWLTAVVVAVAALAAYKGADHTVAAQSQPFPLQIGEVVTFSFQGGGSRPLLGRARDGIGAHAYR